MDSNERQYTLQELADTAGVSIRTIRYYIGEGLLPAPEGAGPQSHYTESHAKRLRAIALLKDRYLPLREIRKELAGLDDAQIDRLIADLGGPETASLADELSAPVAPVDPLFMHDEPRPLYDALSYIDTALERGRSKPQRNRRSIREERAAPKPEGEVWRKVAVAEGVELLVRDDIYRRRRDQIDWLVDWAKKVVD